MFSSQPDFYSCSFLSFWILSISLDQNIKRIFHTADLHIVKLPNSLLNLVSGAKVGDTGYGWMINNKGVIIAHPKENLILNLDIGTVKEMDEILKSMLSGKSGIEHYTFKERG